MKKKMVARVWGVFAGTLMLIMGIVFFNEDILTLTLGNTEYSVRHPSTALWVLIIAAALAAMIANIIDVLIDQKWVKIAVAVVASCSLFISIVYFVYHNPENFTSYDRTRIGIRFVGHDHRYTLSNTYFWDPEREMAWAGDEFAETLKNSKNEKGFISEYEDVVLTKHISEEISELMYEEKEEIKPFRCEVKRLSWDMPIVHYKELDLSNIEYGIALNDLYQICSEIKEDSVNKETAIYVDYNDEKKVYSRWR